MSISISNLQVPVALVPVLLGTLPLSGVTSLTPLPKLSTISNSISSLTRVLVVSKVNSIVPPSSTVFRFDVSV